MNTSHGAQCRTGPNPTLKLEENRMIMTQNGSRPKNWKLKRDPYPLETSISGIFAAGDIRQNAVRRVASAVGQGAIAISLVHQYLKSV